MSALPLESEARRMELDIGLVLHNHTNTESEIHSITTVYSSRDKKSQGINPCLTGEVAWEAEYQEIILKSKAVMTCITKHSSWPTVGTSMKEGITGQV